jgi:2-amino-4-hydroxy-6-hydroxymethyldihydropteridine diphosphokinase
MLHHAAIALGANLGDRAAALQAALDRLRAHPEVYHLVASSFYTTAPVGGPAGQGNYLNAAAVLDTPLPPAELLHLLLSIEATLGRDRTHEERNGPRKLDLDLLLYEDLIRHEPGLTLPHPRMHERAFVLDPLVEVAGEMVHPVRGQTIRQLRAQLVGTSAEQASLPRADPRR